jgi:Protein of unknown function (DUF1003)
MSLHPHGPNSPESSAARAREERRAKFENRLADAITRFAGSMDFVYLSIVLYGLWIAIPLEEYPFGLLTMIVSLEAIFLSTFILIGHWGYPLSRAFAELLIDCEEDRTLLSRDRHPQRRWAPSQW